MVTSSARKYHRANTFPMSKPKTASKITSRPPYVTVSVKPLPLPLSKTMKPIIFKGIQEDLIHKQEQDLTRIAEVSDTFLEQKQSRVGLTEEMKKLISTDSIGQHDSEESNLWTDDDEKAEITCQIQVPRISRNSFVKNVAFLPKMPEKKKQIPTATISNSNTKDVATSNQIAADIPEAKICEIPNQLFFEVLLVDAVTPSQFTFIYNAKNFQTMKNEMR